MNPLTWQNPEQLFVAQVLKKIFYNSVAELRYFKPFCTSHFASGIDHLLDNISYSTAVAIRRELYTLMGRNMYYRIRNKERLLHPCEQEQIAAIFLKHGIKTKPEFDQYIDKYDW